MQKEHKEKESEINGGDVRDRRNSNLVGGDKIGCPARSSCASPKLKSVDVEAGSQRQVGTKEREVMKKSGFANPAKQMPENGDRSQGFVGKMQAREGISRKKEIFNKAIGPAKGGRAATIKVVESCCLLQIDQGFFQKVIMTIIKPELDEKIS